MEHSNFKKLTWTEYIIFIHTVQFAGGFLTLPRTLAIAAGTDGWISIVIGWGITSIVGITIIAFLQKKNDMNFPQILKYYFGNFVGNMLTLLFAVYLFIGGASLLLKSVEIIKIWVFPSTPSNQIIVLLLIPFYILSCHGIQAISRYSMVVFFLTMFMPLFLVFALRQDYHPLHLFPILKEGISPIIIAVKDCFTPYAGLEMAYFIYPYLQKKEKAMLGILIANTGTMILYVFITVLCCVYFSLENMKETLWPTLQLLKGIRFPFLERLEIIYIAYYLMIFSKTIYPYLFSSIHLLTNTFPKLNIQKTIVFYCSVLFVLFTIFHPRVNDLFEINSIIDIIVFIFFILFPILICTYAFIFDWIYRRN
ncbi:spore gernimation protein XA [Bacillus thuringiensis]|uniref:Spore gernimation protein XA n=1 Tax=Bacillus thuringiensis TaxID=1428 RepID=A0A9X7BVF6_BACTU|nr:endospore germination permease [Bacillus thuringiensis]PGH79728.1 spore gernimation protein XA [Bacillus thuringiensis]